MYYRAKIKRKERTNWNSEVYKVICVINIISPKNLGIKKAKDNDKFKYLE